MFRMNGTSRLSTGMCDAKRLRVHLALRRVLELTIRPSAPHRLKIRFNNGAVFRIPTMVEVVRSPAIIAPVTPQVSTS